MFKIYLVRLLLLWEEAATVACFGGGHDFQKRFYPLDYEFSENVNLF